MFKSLKFSLGLTAALLSTSALAAEGSSPVTGVQRLNHVFLIIMENHIYGQIIGNPNAQYINSWAHAANLATNYFGIGHPSSTNYLEITGGSNFGVRSDNFPDWHNATCQPNLATGAVTTDYPASPLVCPIAGSGTDAATPAVDCSNEYTSPACGNDIDGVKSYAAATGTVGKTIADQLVAAHANWKSYQENLPITGTDNVNFSDGKYTNLTNFANINPQLTPPLSQADIVDLYAVKHNPQAYFAAVQAGTTPGLSLSQMVSFEGANGLWEDLARGSVPALSIIVPNQCDDQHGRGNSTAFCNYDPNDNGTQAGLNPALINVGDTTMQKIISSIKNSPTWSTGRNAIVAVWDENDYSAQPNINRVAMIVDKNTGSHELQSGVYYNHFSLLKTIEGAFGLPCLNHACDADTATITDLFNN